MHNVENILNRSDLNCGSLYAVMYFLSTILFLEHVDLSSSEVYDEMVQTHPPAAMSMLHYLEVTSYFPDNNG